MGKSSKAPSVPLMTSHHQQHATARNEHGNVAVRHPALPGPNMMAPRGDHVELPAGSLPKNTPPGGIIGGLAPFQSAKGAQMADFDP